MWRRGTGTGRSRARVHLGGLRLHSPLGGEVALVAWLGLGFGLRVGVGVRVRVRVRVKGWG